MHPSVPIPVWLRLGLRAQLALALGVIGTLLVAVIVSTLLSMAHIHDLASKTVEVEGRLNRLASNVVTYTLLCHRYEKEAFLSLGDRNVRNYYLLLWDGAYFNLNTSIQAFADAAATEADRQRAETWLAQGAKYHESFTQLKQAITRGEITRPEDANAALGPHRGEIQGLTNTALQTAQIKATRAQRAEEELVASTARSTQSTLLIGGIALVVAVAWIVLFPARLMRPIKVLQAAIAQLASGDLTARVRLARNDELGVLASGFDQMARTIQQRTDDIVAQRAQAEAARMEAETARAEIAGQLATIEEQRSVIREMSVPILPLSASTLVMPLVGALDSQRIQLIQEQALQTIEHSSARYLILDITGVPIVDSQVAQGLIQIVQAARLLGTEVVLVGIRPEVAQAVVGLGIHLDTTITRGTLQSGMAYVVQHSQ